ncbi:uncharacterized protein LOC127156665 isoform X1 [Labeo rohita]|uniref:uncharacterized protein LOC127156665 isoform X1 n=1 Tax=Labeo rohita TaxID=84645 RepID=UPI0021E33C27|nr:uncharacterized protein LOC127156665 isoform X1 [Labeo rohita]
MKLNRKQSKWILTLILTFHITSVKAEASHNDEVRILIMGIRGESRFSAADLLSGRKDSGQEDREIVKTPVITDEGRRMMLVTGPNLCEEDTARQTFTTALSLSSPGPHAVLIVLNLEDQQSQQCDIVKRAQELLGEEVLKYCIVLLHQNHQKRLTGAFREMINACGGRFYIISDSEPKLAQTAALVAEIDKLVWLNGDGFYSVLTQKLETEATAQDLPEENPHLSVKYDILGGAVGIVGGIFLALFTTLVIYTEGKDKTLIFGTALTLLVLFMVYLRHFLSPDVAIPFNLALITSIVATLFTTDHKLIKNFRTTNYNISNLSPSILLILILPLLIIVYLHLLLYYLATVILSLPFLLGSSLILGTIVSIRTWSDVFIACYTAPGVIFGALTFLSVYNEIITHESPLFVLRSFLFCSVGAILSKGFVYVFGLLGVKISIILLILGITMVHFHFKGKTIENVMHFIIFIVILPCACVLIGSLVFPSLGLVMSFLKVIVENLVRSYLFYAALLLGTLKVIWRK